MILCKEVLALKFLMKYKDLSLFVFKNCRDFLTRNLISTRIMFNASLFLLCLNKIFNNSKNFKISNINVGMKFMKKASILKITIKNCKEIIFYSIRTFWGHIIPFKSKKEFEEMCLFKRHKTF